MSIYFVNHLQFQKKLYILYKFEIKSNGKSKSNNTKNIENQIDYYLYYKNENLHSLIVCINIVQLCK